MKHIIPSEANSRPVVTPVFFTLLTTDQYWRLFFAGLFLSTVSLQYYHSPTQNVCHTQNVSYLRVLQHESLMSVILAVSTDEVKLLYLIAVTRFDEYYKQWRTHLCDIFRLLSSDILSTLCH